MSTETSSFVMVKKIKKENQNDEIKDFAETAMNELLGWYGYDGVDRIDIPQQLTKTITTPTSDNSSSNSMENHNNNNNNSKTNKCSELNGDFRDSNDITSSNKESSRENSKSPFAIRKVCKQDNFCSWCRREVPENSPDFLATPDGGPRYCSESCFAQSRRASFKRAKTCDWCRHVRHTVSYVDFQDGASQLQFCSDKCLNQYKMQIFCKETQEHLDMNPHLKEQGLENSSSSNLITPDLWLKNCRSRSNSPASIGLSADETILPISRSPSPLQLSSSLVVSQSKTSSSLLSAKEHHHPSSSSFSHHHRPQMSTATTTTGQKLSSTNIKPVISLAPVSKLMSKSPNNCNNSGNSSSNVLNFCHILKHPRRRRVPKLIGTQNHNSNSNSTSSSILNLTTLEKSHSATKPSNIPSATLKPNLLSPRTTTNNFTNMARDLYMNPATVPSRHTDVRSPNLSPMSRRLLSAPNIKAPPPNSFPITQQQQQQQQQSAALPFTINNLPPYLQQHFPPPTMLHNYGLESHQSNYFGSAVPPVTIMVPYPIVVPLPIPIPIPLPVIDFIKAAEQKPTTLANTSSLSPPVATTTKNSTKIHENITKSEESNNDEPLDFTKSKGSLSSIAITVNDTEMSTVTSTRNTLSEKDVLEEPEENSLTETTTTTTEAAVSDEKIEPKKVINTESSDSDRNSVNNNDNIISGTKFKLTRLHAKRLMIKESEKSRPLRKRKRIIDYVQNPNKKDENDFR